MSAAQFDLLLIFGYTLGVFLLASSLRKGPTGVRLAGIAIFPAIAGLAICLWLLFTYFGETLGVWGLASGDLRLVVASLGVVFGAIAIGEMVFTHLPGIGVAIVERTRKIGRSTLTPWVWLPDTWKAIFLGVSVGVVLVASNAFEPRASSRIEVATEATYQLAGAPTDLVFHGESNGYISIITLDGDGQVFRFALPGEPQGELFLEGVATDISFPHGLAILDNVLYVTHQGLLECTDDTARGSFAGVRCAKLPDLSFRESQIELLKSTRGGVLAFDISSDGSLQNRRVILQDLPVSIGDHGINGIIAGPDGRLYLSIGGFDSLVFEDDFADILDSIQRPNLDLVGTIVSFNPDGSGLEVVAKGVRNIYDLTFDEQGRLFGVDNDGPSLRGWHFEEVLHIKPGADYGFPWDGTFSSNRVRTDDPIWIVDTVGSAGVEWAGNLGLATGLVIGGASRVIWVQFDEDENGFLVKNGKRRSRTLLEVPGFVTTVEATPDGRAIIGVFGYSPEAHALHILNFSE